MNLGTDLREDRPSGRRGARAPTAARCRPVEVGFDAVSPDRMTGWGETQQRSADSLVQASGFLKGNETTGMPGSRRDQDDAASGSRYP